MIDATVLGGVVGDCAGWAAELVVEADAGGECEESGRDSRVEIAGGACAVAFEGEQVFAGEEDGFDSLPYWREVDAVSGFVATGWADDGGAEGGDVVGELGAGVAFVADDRFASVECLREQFERGFSFGPVGGDQ